MACNFGESMFQYYQSIVVSVQQSGSTLWVENQSHNIVMIRRILLYYTTTNGSGVIYLRPAPDPISWTFPSTFLEAGCGSVFFTLSAPAKIIQAQAEYIEIEGRSRSCAADSVG